MPMQEMEKPDQAQVAPSAPLVVADRSQVEKDLGLLPTANLTSTKTTKVDPTVEAFANKWLGEILTIKTTDAAAMKQARLDVESMGTPLKDKLAGKSKMLKQQIAALASSAESSAVAKSLIALKVQVDKINPRRFKFLEPGSVGRFFSAVPFVGTTINEYFTKFQSAGSVIEAVALQLREGKEQLGRDIDILLDDKAEMRDLTIRLQQMIQAAMLLDKKLSAAIETMNDAEQKAFLQEEVLFPLRLRIQDLQQNLLVNQQGVISYELIVRNNRELIRGAERCESVTLKALEIAVVTAMALANQRIVLKTMQAIDETTNTLLEQNSEDLKTQGVSIHKQATEQRIKMETLQKCFTNLTAAMDEIARFKQAALEPMAKAIDDANVMASQVEKSISRMERGNQQRPSINFDLVPTGPVNM